jgi:hypothetical protein
VRRFSAAGSELGDHGVRVRRRIYIVVFLGIVASICAHAQTRKVIIDQDARGPATTDQQSMLLLLQSPDVETLGITVVSGDQWRDEEVAHTLRMLELTGHSNVKVYPGAVFPLINSKEEIKRWQTLYTAPSNTRAHGTNITIRPEPVLRQRALGALWAITVPSKFRIRCPKAIPRSNQRAKTPLIS